jgi:hypothetical protein
MTAAEFVELVGWFMLIGAVLIALFGKCFDILNEWVN